MLRVQNIAVSNPLPLDQDRVQEEQFNSTVLPTVWTEQQYLYEQIKRKNNWMFASDEKWLYRCSKVKNLAVRASRGVNISVQWAEDNISFYGSTKEAQFSSLRKKIYEQKNFLAHKEATSILETAQKGTEMHRVSKVPLNLRLECS